MLLPLLALLALPLCLAVSTESMHAELTRRAAASNGVIRLDENTYNMLTHPNRDWSATIQLTAMDKRRRCTPCWEFDPNFNAIAKAWSTVPPAERNSHFFATVDFDEVMPVFQKLGLQSAPVVHVYPATEGPRSPANGKTGPISYEFTHGFDAAPLAEQLSRYTPVPIPYKAPFDWGKLGTFVAFAALFAVGVRVAWPALRNRWVWAGVTVIVSLIMISGYMFTRIRGMPHSGPDGNWIAQGYQNQFGQEVQVVASIYGGLAGAFLMLILATPNQASRSKQRGQVYLWTIVIFVMFSVLLSLFRMKNRGYPFKLLL